MGSDAGQRSVADEAEPGRLSRRATLGLLLACLVLLRLPLISFVFFNDGPEKHCEQVTGPTGATEVCHPIKNLPDDGEP